MHCGVAMRKPHNQMICWGIIKTCSKIKGSRSVTINVDIKF